MTCRGIDRGCVLFRRNGTCRATLSHCLGNVCEGVERMPDRIPPLVQIFTMQNLMWGMAVANVGMLASIWFVRPRRNTNVSNKR